MRSSALTKARLWTAGTLAATGLAVGGLTLHLADTTSTAGSSNDGTTGGGASHVSRHRAGDDGEGRGSTGTSTGSSTGGSSGRTGSVSAGSGPAQTTTSGS